MPDPAGEPLLELARRLVAAGISVIPILPTGLKAPAAEKGHPVLNRHRIATDRELVGWFAGRRRGIAALGGKPSGNLECLDFDEVGLFEQWAEDLKAVAPGLLARLVLVRTPRGGWHVWYRCATVAGNLVPARRDPTPHEVAEAEARGEKRPKFVKLIETRSHGAYALLPGGAPECHELGRPYVYADVGLGDLARVQEVSPEERELVLGLAAAFNRYAAPPKAEPAGPKPKAADGRLLPGNDFDRRGSWRDVLEPHGWKLERGSWEHGRLTRPGKALGVSATIGECKAGEVPLLYVFSTSAAPFEANAAYGRFRAFALLNHDGKWEPAARALGALGYGERRPALNGRPPGGATAHEANGKPEANGQAPGEPAPPWAVRPAGGLSDAGISAAALMALDLPPARFAVDGLLAEGLTVIGGRPKMGKSWLALLVAWAVAGGHALDGRPCQPGQVLFLALEDTRRRLQSRMRMLQGALGWPAPPDLRLHTAWPRADQGGLYHLAEWLAGHKGAARLVVVDTLARFRRPARGTGNNYADDYQALGEIKQLVDLYGCSALAVHHTRKLPAEDPFDELSGTLGVSGAADGLMVLDRRRGAAEGRLFVTGRDVADATIPLALDRETFRWSLGPAAEGIDTSGRHVGTGSNTVDQCAAWLREFLAEYAYPSKELTEAAQAAGFKFSAVREAKAKLGREGTGELVSRNFGQGQAANDWWNGFGPWESWKRRPDPVTRRQSDSPTVRQSGQTVGRDRRSESADGPEVWPG